MWRRIFGRGWRCQDGLGCGTCPSCPPHRCCAGPAPRQGLDLPHAASGWPRGTPLPLHPHQPRALGPGAALGRGCLELGARTEQLGRKPEQSGAECVLLLAPQGFGLQRQQRQSPASSGRVGRRRGGGPAWGTLKLPCTGCSAPARGVPSVPGCLSLLCPEKGPRKGSRPRGPGPRGAPAAPSRPWGAAEMAVTAPQSAEEQSSGKLLMKSSGRPIIGKPERSENGKNNKKI